MGAKGKQACVNFSLRNLLQGYKRICIAGILLNSYLWNHLSFSTLKIGVISQASSFLLIQSVSQLSTSLFTSINSTCKKKKEYCIN